MVLEAVIPFTSSNSHKFLIKFETFKGGVDFSIPLIDISLVLVEPMDNRKVEFKDLISIANLIKDYLNINQVVLYYYCDHSADDLFISDKNKHLLPQEYRSFLFSRMFDFLKIHNFVKDEIIIIDNDNIPHHISLITKKEDRKSLTEISIEVQKMNDK